MEAKTKPNNIINITKIQVQSTQSRPQAWQQSHIFKVLWEANRAGTSLIFGELHCTGPSA